MPSSSFSRVVVVLAALIIAVIGLRVTADFLTPLILGGFVVILGIPLVQALDRRGWPHWLSVGAATALYVAAVALLAVVGLVSLRELRAMADELESGAAQGTSDLTALLEPLAGGAAGDVAGALDPDFLSTLVEKAAGGFVDAAIALGIAGMILIYGLIGARNMPGVALSALGGRRGAQEGWQRFSDGMRTFFGARAALGAGMAIAAGLWLALLGQDLALFWAVVAFFFSFVPNVGLILSVIGPAFVALLTDGWPTALAVVAGYSVINVVIDYVLQPRLMARELNLSPLVVFVSLLMWAAMLGPVGALLAIPMTLGLQVLLASFDDSRWMATLLSNTPPDAGEGLVAEGGFEPPTKGL